MYISLHVFILVALFIFLYFIGFLNVVPHGNNLVQWDGGWYKNVHDNGYNYFPDKQSNSGFFPLFPYMWKFLGVGNAGIAIFNAIAFLIAFLLLAYFFDIKRRNIFLLLSVPSLFFCYIPYSESLFFLSSSLFLIGLHKSNKFLIIAGLFFASTCRAASMFFVPAIFMMEFLSLDFSKKGWR